MNPGYSTGDCSSSLLESTHAHSLINQAPCGNTVIHLFKGAESSSNKKSIFFTSIFKHQKQQLKIKT